ncbi:g004 [Yersinia phage phiR1-37]|uniref:hypothetical protein n=1 Tax=Yersinia phage phiR1-37 TaxID=331278 RepID=UPI00022DBCB0|nr:hypothetical protein phiR1-37_gp004 [Yersinia phage phiR1-37]CCE26028.1 g004 [Yersinia phage phiR1-37]
MKTIKARGFNKNKILDLTPIKETRRSAMDTLMRRILFIEVDISNHMPRLHFDNCNGAKWSNFIANKYYKKVI